MKTTSEYKELLKKEWIDISENEVSEIISNLDNIWNLLFSKYLTKVENYENSSNLL